MANQISIWCPIVEECKLMWRQSAGVVPWILLKAVINILNMRFRGGWVHHAESQSWRMSRSDQIIHKNPPFIKWKSFGLICYWISDADADYLSLIIVTYFWIISVINFIYLYEFLKQKKKQDCRLWSSATVRNKIVL